MGSFSKSARPVLSGTYMDFAIVQPAAVAQSVGRTVALGFTHTWGPLETPTVCTSLADFLAKFGGDTTNPTSGYIAAYEAFKGEGVEGFGGAGEVLCYRMGGAAAAKATRVMTNTTPASAMTITAKYEGTVGNGLRITTQDHAADPTMNEFIVMNGATVLETYLYLDTDIADLCNQINATSAWVTATLTLSGVALAAVTSVALTGGNDGTTLLGSDYTQAMAALEVQKFGILAFENLTDPTIQASVKTWAQTQNAAGRRFFTVFGGALDENITSAVARSATFNDPDIINVGVGSVRDDAMLTSAGVPVVLSTAQLAPRIAGILANRGERYSLTFAKLADTEIINGPTSTDIVRAYDGGVIVLGRTSDRTGGVRLEKGLTSFITKTDAARPRAIYSVPKYVAVMHGLQEDLVTWSDETIIGKTTVDNDTRQAVLAQTNVFLQAREDYGGIQQGWTAYVDPSPPPSDDDPFIAVVISAKFGRSTEQVFFVAQLG